MAEYQMQSQHNYDDIIDLPHPTSNKHPRMPLYDRAAQFSPFAALTGYNDALKEAARQTDTKIELDEDSLAQLNKKLQIISERIGSDAEVSITYFVPDMRKDGGAYVTHTGRVKRIDAYAGILFMADGVNISIEQIYDMEGEILDNC